MTPADLPDPPYDPTTKANGYKPEVDWQRIKSSRTWRLCPSEQRNNLLRLWLESWNEVPAGSWEDDDELIAAAIDMGEREFRAYKDALLRGWYQAKDGRLYHPVIAEQVQAMLDKRLSGRNRVKAWRDKRASKGKGVTRHKDDVTRYEEPVTRYEGDVTRDQRVSNATETGNRKQEVRGKPLTTPLTPQGEASPDGVDAQAWADFTAHRREIRKPLTDRAATKAANMLRTFAPETQREIVDTTVVNRWTGLFPPKSRGTTDATHASTRHESRTERNARLQREAEQRAVDAWHSNGMG